MRPLHGQIERVKYLGDIKPEREMFKATRIPIGISGTRNKDYILKCLNKMDRESIPSTEVLDYLRQSKDPFYIVIDGKRNGFIHHKAYGIKYLGRRTGFVIEGIKDIAVNSVDLRNPNVFYIKKGPVSCTVEPFNPASDARFGAVAKLPSSETKEKGPVSCTVEPFNPASDARFLPADTVLNTEASDAIVATREYNSIDAQQFLKKVGDYILHPGRSNQSEAFGVHYIRNKTDGTGTEK